MRHFLPKIVFVNITNACNLKCKHCYLSSGHPFKNELRTVEWYDIIKQIRDYGVQTIRINGGEPLLRKDIYKILEYAKLQDMKITLVTNSTLINYHTINRLKNKLDILYFSLDGIRETHDTQREFKGLYEKVLHAIDLARKNDISVGVFVTVSKINFSGIENLIEILDSYGVKKLVFFYCSPFGRAKINWKELYIPQKEWSFLQERIREKVKAYKPKMKVLIEPRFKSASNRNSIDCSLLTKRILSIDPEGNVYFCSLMINEEKNWSLGNLRYLSLIEIWENSPAWILIKKEYKRKIMAKCRGCKRLYFCGGGCVADVLISGKRSTENCGPNYYPTCFMKWEVIKDEK